MKKCIFLLLALAAAGTLRAYTEDVKYGGVALLPIVRDLGSGEAFSTVPEQDNMLYNNPACLNYVKFRIHLPEIIWIFNNNFFKTVKYVIDNKDKIQLVDSLNSTSDQAKYEAADELRESIAPIENKWVRMGLSPNININIKNFGAGIYSNTMVNFNLDQGIYAPKIYAWANNDVVITVGAAKRVMDKMAVGASVKFIDRRSTGLVKLSAQDFNNTGEIIFKLLNRIQEPSRAISVTPGLLYPMMEDKLKVGVVMQDLLFLKMGDDVYDALNTNPNVKAGASYNIPLKDKTYFIRHIKVGAGLDDMLNLEGSYYLKNTHLGAEMKLLPCFVRVGLNGGLPCAGIGLDLWAVRGDFVFFGKERGTVPGQNPSWNLMFSMRVGW